MGFSEVLALLRRGEGSLPLTGRYVTVTTVTTVTIAQVSGPVGGKPAAFSVTMSAGGESFARHVVGIIGAAKWRTECRGRGRRRAGMPGTDGRRRQHIPYAATGCRPGGAMARVRSVLHRVGRDFSRGIEE